MITLTVQPCPSLFYSIFVELYTQPLLFFFLCVRVGIPACDSLVYVIFLWPCAHNDGMPGLSVSRTFIVPCEAWFFVINTPCSVCVCVCARQPERAATP